MQARALFYRYIECFWRHVRDSIRCLVCQAAVSSGGTHRNKCAPSRIFCTDTMAGIPTMASMATRQALASHYHLWQLPGWHDAAALFSD